jgi:predicted permease
MQDWLRGIWHDALYGTRMIRRNLAFSVAVIVTLALGIGGNTTIFTLTSALLLKPFPYDNPSRLAVIDVRQKDGQSRCCSLSRFEQIRDHSRSFWGVAVDANDTLALTGGAEPMQVPIGRVSPNFFTLLGVKPHLGRSFADNEGQPAGKPVVMISDSLWHLRFGGDPQIVGKTINLDSTSCIIIGVLPAGIPFPFMAPADVWTPRYFEHSLMSTQRLRQGVGYLTIIARLRPGASRESALAEMEVLSRQYAHDNPKAPDVDPDLAVVVADLRSNTVANLRPGLLVLSAAVGLVLLIACANVTSLLLSRALARRKEIAVRTALGARRSVIIRQLLTESILLAVLAGTVGLAFGYAATRSLATLGHNDLPQGIPISMDGLVLSFTLAISLLTGVIFGIVPAFQLANTDLNSTLRDEGRGSTGGRRGVHIKNLLVVGQVALSLLLLICAGLMVRSFRYLMAVDPGFDAHNLLTMNISLSTVRYADAQKQIAFFDELLRRLSALPGAHATAISAALPLTPKRITPILAEGQPEVSLAERPFVIVEAVNSGFLQAMRIPLRAGRPFTEADHAQAPHTIIVNECLARRFWPNQSPVGRHVVVGRQAAAEIVGVAADVKNSGLAQEVQPQIYLPFPQLPWGNMNLFVRTAGDPNAMAGSIRAQIFALDPDQPVTAVQTVDEIVDASRGQARFMMLLLVIFSAIALTLAVVGIYGVIAYSVAERRQELGIRLALGAEKADIWQMVVRKGLLLISAGIVIGLAAAFACTRVMSSLLYKVHCYDLTIFMLTPVIFTAIGLLASYLPALRATQIDPSEALRGGH